MKRYKTTVYPRNEVAKVIVSESLITIIHKPLPKIRKCENCGAPLSPKNQYAWCRDCQKLKRELEAKK